ncbi:MAG: alkane 1-monooxygenase [Paracoccaceae bacterium]
MTGTNIFTNMKSALPFWLSLVLVPVMLVAAQFGGWALILPFATTLGVISILDLLSGENLTNIDPNTPDDRLFWHRLVTLIWFPVQFLLVFGLIWFASHSTHLSGFEKVILFLGIGQVTGVVGIVYAHELMHQKSSAERLLADLLMGMVLYSHYRSEHLLVHHRYVGTPRDTATALYNENFHRFFWRVLRKALSSAFHAEQAMLQRKGLEWWHASNPFWRYLALQLGFMVLATIVAGWAGLGLFIFQALVAIWHLEIINYIEHYGLTRKHLGSGKYEHAQPRHSWNSAHRVSNWFLINLQCHSDHHYKPNRRFPLLQNYSEADAPMLPFSYPVMFAAALIPPVWLRMMNPRVRKWRAMYYPEITDWSAYKAGTNPMPK